MEKPDRGKVLEYRGFKIVKKPQFVVINDATSGLIKEMMERRNKEWLNEAKKKIDLAIKENGL